MEIVHTRKFTVSAWEFFKIIATNRLRNYGWVYLFAFAAATANIRFIGESDLATFLVIFGYTYPFLIFAYLYYFAKSQENQSV